MRRNHRASIFMVAALLLGAVGTAQAQDSTSGAVRGLVRDQANNEPVIGATVVASGPALQGTQATITDETGQYTIANLPPGTYTVVIYYADAQFSRTNVLVQLGKVAKVNININTQAQAGETIVIEGRAPLIDQNSTKTGNTVTRDYTENIPTGRTFGTVLGATGGSQDDFYGTSLSGSTSNENTYIVEGINTTDPGFGLLSTNLPNEFIQETEVITGGYNAEYGRSTGGVINVVTKAGSNEFHGSVFGYWTPGALVANEKPTAVAGSSIAREDNLVNRFDLGAEVGGPIIKDRLWFHVGINPSYESEDVTRILSRQIDEDQDGLPDTDENGFAVLDELGRSNEFEETRATYYYSAKLTGAVTPDHQGSFAVLGSPNTRDVYGDGKDTITGTLASIALEEERNILDTSAKWTSKFFDSKTQIDAVVGYHLDDNKDNPGLEGGDSSRVAYTPGRPITDFEMYEQQDFRGVPGECVDGTPDDPGDDPYPLITNCPVPGYRIGGLNFNEDQKATRLSGLLSLTQRVQALGHHVIKVGGDVEEQGFLDSRYYPGGAQYQELSDGSFVIRSFETPDGDGEIPCGTDNDGDDMLDARCRGIAEGDELSADTRTRNFGAYVQDSWSILPNLTLNAGLRWEQQTLYVAEGVAGEISPVTSQPIPEVAFKLQNLLAPRAGIVYDWTQEGRSKLFAHYGRFYESIPMDINSRAYGGEVIRQNYYVPGACDPLDPVGQCNEAGFDGTLNYGGDTIVDPDIRAQYLDEVVVGGEYEILPDLKLGASYIYRDLGRVIEDVSTDGGTTYIVANPGAVNEDEVASLREQAMETNDAQDAAFLRRKADYFEGVGVFDEPKRTYNALQVTLERRFTKSIFVSASYTYSETRGNYPGLFSHETEQLDPNLTSLYDLPELMANRYGNLGSDRPHLVRLDGFYRLLLDPSIGFFTFGAAIRAQSGLPINTLGRHFGYGVEESYILERGAGGRMGLTTRFDTHVAYGRNLTEGTRLEAFVDLFNLFNQQPELRIDDSYTFDNTNPIVGGDDEDLAHAKVQYQGTAIERNPNFGNTEERQPPFSARFGLRLIF
jgi:outer membrane receptor protein involved in Fe transport